MNKEVEKRLKEIEDTPMTMGTHLSYSHLISDYAKNQQFLLALVNRYRSALKSVVGFEPFNSLEPRKASEALNFNPEEKAE